MVPTQGDPCEINQNGSKFNLKIVFFIPNVIKSWLHIFVSLFAKENSNSSFEWFSLLNVPNFEISSGWIFGEVIIEKHCKVFQEGAASTMISACTLEIVLSVWIVTAQYFLLASKYHSQPQNINGQRWNYHI